MQSRIETGQLIGTVFAFVSVLAFELAYCILGHAGRLRLSRGAWFYIGNPCLCMILGSVCAALFGLLGQHAFTIVVIWKGVSVSSILLLEIRYVCLGRHDGPFPGWRTIIFWTCLLVQVAFGGAGAIKLTRGSEILWAIPLPSHLNIFATAIRDVIGRECDTSPRWLAHLRVLAGAGASAMSVALLLGSVQGWAREQAAGQCVLCMIIISVEVIKGWRQANEMRRHSGMEPWDNSPPVGFDTESLRSSAGRVNPGICLVSSSQPTELTCGGSTTTLSSELLRYHYIGDMAFPGWILSAFRVDEGMRECMESIHAFLKVIDRGNLVPAQVGRPKSVLDVGTGTGDWAMDVADAFKEADVIGTDLAPIQPTFGPANLTFYVEDANASSTWWSAPRFDYIHIRGLNGGIKDWGVTLRAAFQCLIPGGFIELVDIIYHPLTDLAAPNGAWGEWSRMLGVLEEAGFSFGHNGGRVRGEMRNIGYDVVDEDDTKQVQVTQDTFTYAGRGILESFIEQMKGIFARALELEPNPRSVERCRELVRELEREVIEGGLRVQIVRILAQKPVGTP